MPSDSGLRRRQVAAAVEEGGVYGKKSGSKAGCSRPGGFSTNWYTFWIPRELSEASTLAVNGVRDNIRQRGGGIVGHVASKARAG